LETPIKGTATEAEGRSGVLCIAVTARQGFRNQEAFDIFKAHILNGGATILSSPEAQINCADHTAL
jgi:hypothetical protein